MSNFNGQGPARVGAYHGISPVGAYDMAGNVKEWCWNSVGDKRYILGGAWNEPTYMFTDADAQSAFDRSPTFGFRLVKNTAAVPDAAFAAITWPYRDLNKEKPVADSVFEAFKRMYAYDKGPLDAKTVRLHSAIGADPALRFTGELRIAPSTGTACRPKY